MGQGGWRWEGLAGGVLGWVRGGPETTRKGCMDACEQRQTRTGSSAGI